MRLVKKMRPMDTKRKERLRKASRARRRRELDTLLKEECAISWHDFKERFPSTKEALREILYENFSLRLGNLARELLHS